MKVALAILASLALIATLFLAVAASREKRATEQVIKTLQASRLDVADPINLSRLQGLPAPVVRYLRHVLRDGQMPIRVARLEQAGALRTDIKKERWSPFEARQIVVPTHGFVWDARVSIAPLVHVRVRDSYVDGRGSGRVCVFSAITIASDSGGPEINSGALHRYLAEAVWYPTALLPSASLKWTAISDTVALATLRDRATSVSLEFRFNDVGEVTGIFSLARWGRFNDAYAQAPWEGHFRAYERRDGMLVPAEGEVGWYVSDQWRSVWKGKIVDAVYDFAQ